MVPSDVITLLFSNRNDSSTAFLSHWLTTQPAPVFCAPRRLPSSRPAITWATASRSSALPFDGVISARTASVGSVLSAGSELFRLIRQARLEWRAEVTASELGRLQAGTIALVTASNGSVLKGSVRMIGPTVDPQTRSALVYVDLPQETTKQVSKQAPFKAGMFASGRFELGTSKAMTVEQQSVVVRDGFSYVFRLNPDQRVSQVKVKLGRRVGTRIEVLDGIAQDTRIALAGAGFQNDGDLVHVVDSPATTVPASPAH